MFIALEKLGAINMLLLRARALDTDDEHFRASSLNFKYA
jgi:hypothetical protein